MVKSVRYGAFGNVIAETGAGELGRYAWTGREWDAEIEMQYNRARYYDPTNGRWVTQDPMGFFAGDSNLYRYVNNIPTNYIDPSGLDEVFPEFADNGNTVIKTGVTKKTSQLPIDNKLLGLKGSIVVSKTNIDDREAAFLAYQGTNSKLVKWFQVLHLTVRPIVKTNDDALLLAKPTKVIELQVPEGQPDWGGTKMKTSTAQTKQPKQLYHDTGINNTIWYNDSSWDKKPGLGRSNEKFSWIADSPSIIPYWAEKYGQQIEAEAKVPGKVLGYVLFAQFDNYAVLDNGPGSRTVFAHVAWEAYSSTEKLFAGLSTSFIDERNGKNYEMKFIPELQIEQVQSGQIDLKDLKNTLFPGKNGSGFRGDLMYGKTHWGINWGVGKLPGEI